MRLASRRPGTATAFVDASSGEVLFKVASDDDGGLLIAFRLYDATGSLVAESEGLDRFPLGLTVRCSNDELLLDVPADPSDHIQYRLYNQTGSLLTWSDGARTKIFSLLRMEGSRS